MTILILIDLIDLSNKLRFFENNCYPRKTVWIHSITEMNRIIEKTGFIAVVFCGFILNIIITFTSGCFYLDTRYIVIQIFNDRSITNRWITMLSYFNESHGARIPCISSINPIYETLVTTSVKSLQKKKFFFNKLCLIMVSTFGSVL